MATQHRQISTVGYLCSMTGLIWGIALGSVLVMVPLAVFLVMWVPEPYFVIGGLVPQVIAILVLAREGSTSLGYIVHPKLAVESIGGFVVEFLLGLLIPFIALPYIVFLTACWIAYVITRDKKWLDFYDLAMYRTVGLPPGDSTGPRRPGTHDE